MGGGGLVWGLKERKRDGERGKRRTDLEFPSGIG